MPARVSDDLAPLGVPHLAHLIRGDPLRCDVVEIAIIKLKYIDSQRHWQSATGVYTVFTQYTEEVNGWCKLYPLPSPTSIS